MGKTNPMKSWTLAPLKPGNGLVQHRRMPSRISDLMCLKAILLSLFLLAPHVSLPAIAQDIESQVNGTWSGNWSPKGGVPDAVTVELQLNAGKLTGKFRTPATMEFTKASFDSKTHSVAAEASDPQSGKLFKLAGKIEGTELKGTLDTNETTGEIRLIKWTFFGR